MNGLWYLFAAFAAVWIVIFLYLFNLSRKQRALRRDLEAIRDRLSEEDQRES